MSLSLEDVRIEVTGWRDEHIQTEKENILKPLNRTLFMVRMVRELR